MADTAQADYAAESSVGDSTADGRTIFRAQQRSIVAALALIVSAALTFLMGFNEVFFVEAMAWTFLIWGILLMYNHVIDSSTRYEVTDGSLILRSPALVWKMKREWDWEHIYKLALEVERTEASPEDVEMQIYYTPAGSTTMHREDVNYLNPDLAREIVARADLKPARNQAMQDFSHIPQDQKTTYVWE